MVYKVIVSQNTQPITNYLYQRASMNHVPLSGTFELSPVCNFSCRMCYVRKTRKEVLAHDRPMLTLEQWIEIAKQARGAGMLYLLLTGGEPFLWPGFWELYEELVRMGFIISINTNGSLLNAEALERLRELPPARINITLYGASDETYETLCCAKNVFSGVTSAICKLKEIGIPVKINCSLTPHNAHDLKKIIDFSNKHQVMIDVSTYMFPPLRRDATMVGVNDRFSPKEAAINHLKRNLYQQGQDGYDRFLKKLIAGECIPPGLDESCIDPLDGKIRCRAGKAAFWITWDGWMTPCGMMPEPKVDLIKLGFKDAWSELTEVTESLVTSGVCAKCPDRQLCHSCAAMALAETGKTSEVPKYLCSMVMEMKKLAAEELAAGNSAKP